MTYLFKYLKTYQRPFFFGLFFLSLEATCDLLQPTIMSNMINKGVKLKDLNMIFLLGGLMLGVTAFGAIFALSRNYLASVVSQKFSRDLRYDVFQKVQKISFDRMDEIEQGSLITRLTNDITQIQSFSFGIMRVSLKAPILIMGAIIMMLILNVKLTLILIVVFPIAVFLIALSMKIGYPYFLKIQQALDHLNTALREYLSGVRVVKAFNSFEHEEQRFNTVNLSLSEATVKTMRIMAYFSPLMALVVNLGIAVLIYMGAIDVNIGILDVGTIMAFVMFMTQILNSLSMMTNIFNMMIRAQASSDRVKEILDSENSSGLTEGTRDLDQTQFHLSFNHVTFSYKGTLGLPVVRDLSFECRSGETIGMIGSTGSGKTTIFSLLLRFYDVSEGEILINGQNIQSMNVHDLRSLIGHVAQKNILFSGSIQQNLLMGNVDASKEDIEKSCQIAMAHEFIERFPEKYGTLIGQSGVNLSGGQKQRLCIARALIKKPAIILLDDATSAIDATTEYSIRTSLKTQLKSSITLLISQRIASIVNCDRILVLENGMTVGYGTHQELLASCSVYQDIYHSQMGEGVAV